MSNRDDDILAREIGKVGRGPGLGGLAASLGAQFVSKFLPTETFTEKLALRIAPERALKLGFLVFTTIGKVQAEYNNKAPYPLLKAVIGSGFLNMNPAVVYLEILEGNSTGCKITITAEGLIKQKTAAKAVQRVVSALRGVANEQREQ
jgi:hypothetical protein